MASEKVLSAKKKIVAEIRDKVSNAKSIILADYRGLSVGELTLLRKKLKEAQSDIKIYKNTLIKLAFDDLKIDLPAEHLEGPNAIAFSDDPILPVKVLSDFAKKNIQLELKVGIIDGVISNKETLASLAKLPSKEGLLTMLAGGLLGVVKNLAIALDLVAVQKENKEGGMKNG